jgi:hypothetical protein
MAAFGVEFMMLEQSEEDPLTNWLYVDTCDCTRSMRTEIHAIDRSGRHGRANVNFSRAKRSGIGCSRERVPASIAYHVHRFFKRIANRAPTQRHSLSKIANPLHRDYSFLNEASKFEALAI